MFGSSRFKWVAGEYYHYGVAKFPTTLGLSDADANAGTAKQGKLMGLADNNAEEMKYGGVNGNFLGILTHHVNKDGTTSDSGFKDFTIGKQDIPLKRGQAVTLRVPLPGAIAEFEGVGAVGIDTLVVTSGTGLLASGSALWSPLTIESGAWRIAQSGAGVNEFVYAHLMQANLTPENSGEVRIRVKFVSPYLFTADT